MNEGPGPGDQKKWFRAAASKYLIPYLKEHWKLGITGTIGMILLSLLALPAPFVTKIIIDDILATGNIRSFSILINILFITYAAKFIVSYLTMYSFNRVSLEITTNIKKDLFSRILQLPLAYFAKNQTGYTVARINEIEGLNLFFSTALLQVLIACFELVFCLFLLFYLNYKLSLTVIMVLPVLFLMSRHFSKKLRHLSWTSYEKSAIIGHQIQDSISGVEVIKAFQGEQRETSKVGKSLNELKETNVTKLLQIAFYSESIGLLGSLTGLYILWKSGVGIIAGSFTLGSYLAFSAYFAKMLGPMQLMANIGISLQPAKVALSRLDQLMSIAPEDDISAKTKLGSVKGKIVFDDVGFSYNPEKPILSNINIVVQPGDKVSIVGPNGSGKSTLIKLILNLYTPQRGEILLDDRPLQSISKTSLRERISIVAQNTFLFNDTIRNNVMYSFPDASQAELKEAICLSGASEFVARLPQGLDTPVGERGMLLSGGEKQKLSIARAILKRSDIIIFDEATTHLDDWSVNKFEELFVTRLKEKTCILISHDKFLLGCFNRFFLVKNGALHEVQ